MAKLHFTALGVKSYSNEFKDAFTSETLTDQYNMVTNDESNYAWNKLFPTKKVMKKKGKIYSLGKQGMQIVDHSVSSKGGLHKIEFEAKQRDLYELGDYGFYADIFKDEVQNPDEPVEAQRDKLALLRSIHNLTKESQALALAFDPAFNPNNVALAAGDQFSNPASDPYAVIIALKRNSQLLSGRTPNKMAITQDVMDALTVHPSIIARYAPTVTLTQSAMEDILMRDFKFDEIIVIDSLEWSGSLTDIDGGTFAFLQEKKMLLFYSSNEEFLKPLSFGHTYTRNETTVWTVDADARTQKIEKIVSSVGVDDEYQFVITNQDAGFLATDVVA